MLVTWLFFCLCQWDIVWEQPDGNIPGTVSLSQQPGLLCEHQLSPQWNHKTWYPSGKKKNVHPYIPLVEHRRDFTLVTLKNLQRPVVLGFSHMCVLWFQFFFKSFTGLSLSVLMWRTKARQHSGSGALLITSEPATQSGLVYHITYINQLCGPFGTAHSEMNFIRIWRLLFGLLCSGHLETQQWSDDSR